MTDAEIIKADIERLTAENAILRRYIGIESESQLSQIVADTYLATNIIKAEAIKEFAEKLKSRLITVTYMNFGDTIDNLVKEMVGDAE